MGSTVDLLILSGEIGRGGGDGGDAEGGPVPDEALVELGDGEVEALPQLVFHGADDLAPVLEGLGVWDLDLEDESGYGHSPPPPWISG